MAMFIEAHYCRSCDAVEAACPCCGGRMREAFREADNCGTGDGGFQPGNTCATGASSQTPWDGDDGYEIAKGVHDVFRAVDPDIDVLVHSSDVAPKGPDGEYTGEVVKRWRVEVKISDPYGALIRQIKSDPPGPKEAQKIIKAMRAELVKRAKDARAHRRFTHNIDR